MSASEPKRREADEDELDAFARGQRRGRRIGIAVTLVLVAAIAAGLVYGYYFLGGRHTVCRGADLKGLYSLPPEQARLAVHDACRFDGKLGEMLSSLKSVPPRMRKLLVMRALATDVSLLLSICGTTGPKVIAKALASFPSRQSSLLVEGCRLADLGAATADELRRVDLEPLVIGALVFVYLRDKKEPAASRVARRIWGL